MAGTGVSSALSTERLIAVIEQPGSVKKLFIADQEQGRGCVSGQGFSLKSLLFLRRK